jgi:hypothetical protein
VSPRFFLLIFVALAGAHPALAQSPPAMAFDGPPAPVAPAVVARDADGRTTVRAVRLTAPLRIDGALDEPIYGSVPSMSDFVQSEPQTGIPATEKTEVWISFDDDNLYLTFKCWDSQPERRVATEMRRDANGLYSGNDVVNFFLDPFFDHRNGLSFTVNAIGGRSDGQVSDRQYLSDWNPIWDHATGRFDGGWTAEVMVPFRSLRYRSGVAQIWGVNVLRTVRWRNELSTLAPIPPGRGMEGVRQRPLATLVGIEAPPASTNLEIKPYALATVTTDRGVLPNLSNDVGRDLGLDVKYGVTEGLTADFTYNTDFAQVEADEQQVNLTRFSLFFPEKREFFLENQGIFFFGGVSSGGFGGGGDTPMLFYSRRIGLDGGRPVPVDGGGRLTGRAGRYTVGLVNIQTDAVPANGVRATNFSVVRVKRDILRRSSIGALFTNRSVGEAGAGANSAVGMDATFTFYNNLAINSYWARTRTDGVRGDDTSYRAHLDYGGDRYGVQFDRLRVGDNFNPEVGFVRRDNIRRTLGELRFSPRPRTVRTVRRFWWMGVVDYFEDGTGRVDSRDRSGEFALEFQNADRFSLVYTNSYEFIPRPFRIASDVTLPVGGYDWNTVRVGYTLGQQRRMLTNFVVERGTFYNGRRTAVSATRSRISVTPQLSLEPTYTLNRVELVQGAFTSHLAGSRVTFTMSPRMFASALVQYNSASNAVGANVRLRWEYRPGSELFVVYNDERDTRAAGFPDLATRAFIVKVNRLFRF